MTPARRCPARGEVLSAVYDYRASGMVLRQDDAFSFHAPLAQW